MNLPNFQVKMQMACYTKASRRFATFQSSSSSVQAAISSCGLSCLFVACSSPNLDPFAQILQLLLVYVLQLGTHLKCEWCAFEDRTCVFHVPYMFPITPPCFPSSPLTFSHQLSSWCWPPASPSASCPSPPWSSALDHCSPERWQLNIIFIQQVRRKPLWPSQQPSLPGHFASPWWPQQSLLPVLLVAEPIKQCLVIFVMCAGSNEGRKVACTKTYMFLGTGWCLSLEIRKWRPSLSSLYDHWSSSGDCFWFKLLVSIIVGVCEYWCTWAASIIFFRISSWAVRCALIISQLSFLCFVISSVHSFVCSATIPISLVSASACNMFS